VQITQAATQASITGTNTVANSTTIDGTNDTFSITVDGASSGPITLAHGTYSAQGLAQALQTAVNGNSALKNRNVTVGVVNGNQLVFTSGTFGSSSRVAIGTGTALSALGFTGSQSSQGTDVAGSFIVNGVTEAATGLGQVLTVNAGNANTAGLEVVVTLTPAQITPTPEASLTVSRGIASGLKTILGGMLDPVTGRLANIDQSLQDRLTQLQNEVTQQNQAMAAKQ
jgi:flagellar hook-associated protein 2